MKKYFSIPLHLLIGLIVFYAAANAARLVAYGAQNWYRGYYWKKAQAEYERPFREDKIGGQTPEETWEMFIAALEAGDIDKASGYFHVTKREEEKKRLLDKQAKNELINFVEQLKDNFTHAKKENVYDDDVRFRYKTYRKAGVYTVSYPDGRTEEKNFPAGEIDGWIQFIKNINNNWKIYRL